MNQVQIILEDQPLIIPSITLTTVLLLTLRRQLTTVSWLY